MLPEFDLLKNSLESPTLSAEQRLALLGALQKIEKSQARLDFNYNRALKDKQTLSVLLQRISEDLTAAREEIEQLHQESERLLLNILPAPIASRLKSGEEVIADSYQDVTVLFADIVGFTPLSSQVTPQQLVHMLDDIFSLFDALAEQNGLEKIKTVGDSYMVVGGLLAARPDHPEAVARMALQMLEALAQFNHVNQQQLNMRIGINTGPVVAGVIGRKKFSYDLWGDTVNIASRMESHGVAGCIHMTAATCDRLHGTFTFAERGSIEVKGKGLMTTYFLTGKQI